jgi:MFS family permease
LLAVCFVLFTFARDFWMLYAMAAFYGLCIGIVFPLLNATMFSISPARLRGLNANLTLFMMDAGYAFSPSIGGALHAAGYPFNALFKLCAGWVLLGLALAILLKEHRSSVQVE